MCSESKGTSLGLLVQEYDAKGFKNRELLDLGLELGSLQKGSIEYGKGHSFSTYAQSLLIKICCVRLALQCYCSSRIKFQN